MAVQAATRPEVCAKKVTSAQISLVMVLKKKCVSTPFKKQGNAAFTLSFATKSHPNVCSEIVSGAEIS